ncbi:MAG: antirestriction protein ArdA [Paludibacteraceae bacterium]|nr:antirestriction protein ArdA [Paludibacteraceae bacterium]
MEVYVGTYEKYNNGSLFGKWLDLADFEDKADFYRACLELHNDEEDPELMFQDWEDIPDEMIGECWISDELWNDLDEEDFLIFSEYKKFVDNSVKPCDIDEIKEKLACNIEDWNDYADEMADEQLENCEEWIQLCFDYEKWRLHMSYDHYFTDNYVFRAF